MQEQIKNINTLEELQSLYTATFGKNGTMTAKLKNMKNLDNDARAELNREIRCCVNCSNRARRKLKTRR